MGASEYFGCSLLNQQTMSKAEEFLDREYFSLIGDCKRELPYIISAMQEYADQEVERYKRENTFDEWCKKYVKPQGENVYLYNKTAYSLHELIAIFNKIKPTNDETNN